MDMACFDETVEPCFSDQETSKKSTSASAAGDDQPPPSRSASCFDCSICLDFPVDPAVTLCGHLYCWPCIYKWMHSDTASSSPHIYCPVCKAPLSENALVPLYGRGSGGGGSRKNHHLDVPKRQNVQRDAIASMIIDEQRRHSRPSDDDGYITSRVFSSTAGGVLALAVQPLLIAGSGYLTSRRPYRLERSGSSPRERRREVLVEDSLHQLWVFLLCAAVLCLLFF